MPSIPPWASAVFELIVHGEEHLLGGDDFGRRMALISFDNAIEVAITTYLCLPPELRGNRSYKREDCNRWLQNYHTKLEFLEAELTNRDKPWEVARNHIIWAHNHRNEQYHGGAKGTPERDVIRIARAAALWVFGLLFDINHPEALLETAVRQRLPAPPPQRNGKFDQAIDEAFGPVEIAGLVYSASEVLFAVDYDAYVTLGQELSSYKEEDLTTEETELR